MSENAVKLIIAVIFSFALPLGLIIFWKLKTGEKLWSFIAGALCFLVFAMILENILHEFCLVLDNPVSRAVTASPWLYALYAAFAAGIFEETGRYFAFSVLLRKNRRNSCAIAYGIGHGGIEVLLIVGINYLILLLAVLGVQFGDTATSSKLIETAASIPFSNVLIALFERISAMMIHVGLSAVVFCAVKDRKFLLFPLAIVLHALTDAPAALYQYQTLTSLFIVESAAFIMGVVSLTLGIILLLKRKKAYEALREAVPETKSNEQ